MADVVQLLGQRSSRMRLLLTLRCPLFQLGDVAEKEDNMTYMRSSGGGSASSGDEPRGPSKGFVVREAPWTTGTEKVSQRG